MSETKPWKDSAGHLAVATSLAASMQGALAQQSAEPAASAPASAASAPASAASAPALSPALPPAAPEKAASAPSQAASAPGASAVPVNPIRRLAERVLLKSDPVAEKITNVLVNGVKFGDGFTLRPEPFSKPRLRLGYEKGALSSELSPEGLTRLTFTKRHEGANIETGILPPVAPRGLADLQGTLTPQSAAPIAVPALGGGLGVRMTKIENQGNSTSVQGVQLSVDTKLQGPVSSDIPKKSLFTARFDMDSASSAAVFEGKRGIGAEFATGKLWTQGNVSYRLSGYALAEKGGHAAAIAAQADRRAIRVGDIEMKAFVAARATHAQGVSAPQIERGSDAQLSFGVARSVFSDAAHLFVQQTVGDGKPKWQVGLEVGGKTSSIKIGRGR